VRKMESSNHFRQTYLATERQSEENPNGDRVEFEIGALYVPAGEKNAVAGGLN